MCCLTKWIVRFLHLMLVDLSSTVECSFQQIFRSYSFKKNNNKWEKYTNLCLCWHDSLFLDVYDKHNKYNDILILHMSYPIFGLWKDFVHVVRSNRNLPKMHTMYYDHINLEKSATQSSSKGQGIQVPPAYKAIRYY